MAQDDIHVGIDVAKERLDICIWPSGERLAVGNDRGGHAALVRRLRGLAPIAIGLEASGGYERDVLAALREAGLPVHRLNPLRVRRFAQGCGFIAKNAQIVLKRLAQRRIRQLKAEIVLLDRTIAQAVAADAWLARKDALLRSVPGVGPVTSHTLLAFMTELGQIENRQASALVGVAPFDCESGGFKGQRRIAGGRKPVRDALYMAALVASRFNPVLANFKQRLAQQGKPPKVILIAIARKLLSILNAILRTNTPWTA